MERIALNDKSLHNSRKAVVLKAFKHYELSFLVHAATESQRPLAVHWLETIGLTTSNLMNAGKQVRQMPIVKVTHGLKALSLMLGVVVIGLAASVILSGNTSSHILGWALDVLGLPFILLLGSLVFASLLALVKLYETTSIQNAAERDSRRLKWLQAGQQCCNGIATLALTFTLLGISLGIGQLSDGGLTPENINQVIANLTSQFSLAFMTSVIGLPLSAALRTVLIVTNASLLVVSENKLENPKSGSTNPLVANSIF